MTTPSFPGIKVTVGGREFVVPSLTYGEHKRLRGQGLFDKKDFDFGRLAEDDLTIAKTALLHNYPELRDEELEALTPLELGELARAVVYATIGLKEIPPGPEARSPGTASGGPTESSASGSS